MSEGAEAQAFLPQESHPDFEGVNALLNSTGEPQKELENHLEALKQDEQDFASGFDYCGERRCNLCSITDYPFSIGESVTYRDEDFFMVEPERMKDHNVREMTVLNNDHRFPSNVELESYADKILRELKQKVDRQTSEEAFTVIYSGMNTQDQPHLIGSDLRPGSIEESGLEDVNNFLLYRPGDDALSPSLSSFNDIIGEAFLQRVYEVARRD